MRFSILTLGDNYAEIRSHEQFYHEVIEEAVYGEADRLLDAVLATDPANVAWLALRAQSALEAGDTVTGLVYYRRALAAASNDSTDAIV